jgi:pyruvate dehydrogenase E1 component alpha subunit
MMAEIYGKATGICKGKGGSMHIADFRVGMLGANGIVGGGPPLVCGVGLASKVKGSGQVGVAFLGDGASNQGTFLESLNLSAIWKLPVVFVVENNGYGEATGQAYHQSVEDTAKRADGFGLPGITVDGNDFFAVSEAVGEAVARARAGHGPTLVECKTTRFFGHFEGDTQAYRDLDEVVEARASRDCLVAFRARAVDAGLLAAAELDAIDAEVAVLIDESVAEALAAPWPDASQLSTDVYIKY